MLIGGWLRYSSTFLSGIPAITILLAGQCFAALAQPAFTNTPAKVSGQWFGDRERDIATVVGALLNPVGNAAGQFVPTLFISC